MNKKSTLTALFAAAILGACAQLNQPNFIHFANDLKAESTRVAPAENMVLILKLPHPASPQTVIGLYESSHKNGPFKQLNTTYELVAEDVVKFTLPTSEIEAGHRYFQAIMYVYGLKGPSAKSDVERITITKPKHTYLQSIHFGSRSGDAVGPIYMCTGKTRQLKIMGKYADGLVRPLTTPELGTRYKVMNPPYYQGTYVTRAVVDVTESGMLEALTHGKATLIVTNANISNSRDIFVDKCENMPLSK